MMKDATRQSLVKKTVILLLAIVIVLYIVTGFGITEFRAIETLTFGLLTKNLAFKIHNALLIPSIILLILHLCLPFLFRKLNQQNKSETR